jgi:hypothetical protein
LYNTPFPAHLLDRLFQGTMTRVSSVVSYKIRDSCPTR